MTNAPDRLAEALKDRYTLERELGAGGMATVYLAEDVKHRRKVALKVLRPELAAAMGPERFAREIEVAARLQHPHLLPLHDSGEAAGFFYYVMPYVEGETLRDRLVRSGELPVHDAVRLLGEIAEALAVAHQAGVVHRDIKPENILLSGRHALVMDFGVAKAVTEAAGPRQLTTAGVALGTPDYMAPEQAMADPQVDHRVDIYALGVVAYEMLTGAPPFPGLSPQQTLAAHVIEPPPPLAGRRPGLPAALDAAVMRCLAKRPADRFQTAEELAAVLEGLATPSGGMTPTQTRPFPALRRRARRGAIIAAGAAGALVLAGLVWVLLGRSAARPLALEGSIPVTNDPGAEIDPALSPDGTLLAYASGPPFETRIYVRQVDGGRPVAVGDSAELGQRQPKWSPDGRSILYGVPDGEGGRLVVVPALGGNARTVARTPNWRWGADWSPDGREVVFVQGDSLLVIAVDGGAPRLLTRLEDPHSPAWSPDGGTIAVVTGNSQYTDINQYGNTAVSSIVLVPAGGGEPVALLDSTALAASPAWLPDGRTLLFVSDRGGVRDVHALRLTGGGRREGAPERLTSGLRPHSISLDRAGRRLAYNAYTPTANLWSVEIPRTGVALASRALPLTRGSQVVEGLSLSPDGRWAYYASDRTGRFELYRVPSAGGEPAQLTDAPGGNFAPAPCGPDGRWISFHSMRYGTRDIFVMPAEGGAAEPVYVGPGSQYGPGCVSKDGERWVAFGSEGIGGQPRGAYRVEWTGSSWSEPQFWPGIESSWGIAISPHGDSLFTQPLGPSSRLLWARRNAEDPIVADLFLSSDPVGGEAGHEEDPPGRFPRTARRIFLVSASPAPSIWELPVTGGTPRQVVRFDDPNRLPLRLMAAATENRLLFGLDERESDIWVADVRLR